MLRILTPALTRFTGPALVVLLALSGCGGSTEQGDTGDTPTGSTTTALPATSSTTDAPATSLATSKPAPSTTDPVKSALQRRDTPPEGVRVQFEFFQIGDGACFGLDESNPAVAVEFPKPEIAMTFIICFPGFTHDQPVQADVRLPDGKVRKITATFFNSPEGVPYTDWTTVPGDPLGKYQVSATQGTLEGVGSFTVSAASTPRYVEIAPSSGPPGTTFRFGLAGYTPKDLVDLYLYKSEGDSNYTYLTKLSARMDAKGQTILSVPTSPDDPKGGYCLLLRGPKAAPDYSCDLTFTVT